MTWTILRAGAPAIAVTTGATLPMVIAIGRRACVAIPVLVGIVAPRLVLIVTTPRRLSLLYRVRSRLDGQVVGRQLRRWRRRAHPAVVIRRWTVLPLAVVVRILILSVVLMPTAPVLSTLGAAVLQLIGQRLRADTDT
ncbi:hypothetical protein D3C73_1217930 [compost metagenome]